MKSHANKRILDELFPYIRRYQELASVHGINDIFQDNDRSVMWLFAAYKGIELQALYTMEPEVLEPYFSKWENEWYARGGKDINNPKIPLKFVAKYGELVYHIESDN